MGNTNVSANLSLPGLSFTVTAAILICIYGISLLAKHFRLQPSRECPGRPSDKAGQEVGVPNAALDEIGKSSNLGEDNGSDGGLRARRRRVFGLRRRERKAGSTTSDVEP